jgi:hypothetical protein
MSLAELFIRGRMYPQDSFLEWDVGEGYVGGCLAFFLRSVGGGIVE